jgi:hypothetical protein
MSRMKIYDLEEPDIDSRLGTVYFVMHLISPNSSIGTLVHWYIESIRHTLISTITMREVHSPY